MSGRADGEAIPLGDKEWHSDRGGCANEVFTSGKAAMIG